MTCYIQLIINILKVSNRSEKDLCVMQLSQITSAYLGFSKCIKLIGNLNAFKSIFSILNGLLTLFI